MNENYARGAEAAQEHIDTFGLSSAIESASLVESLFGRMDWWRIGYVTTVRVAMERQWA